VPANDQPQVLTISGTGKKEIQDVLVGEVWMCSGQSNWALPGGDWNGDIDADASRLPNLRLIKVPQVGTQELQSDFKGAWRASTADTAKNFSAVACTLAATAPYMGVPVGSSTTRGAVRLRKHGFGAKLSRKIRASGRSWTEPPGRSPPAE
jgi:sialate O-acetylesterase